MTESEAVVCARVRKFREHLNLSQSQFASEIGLSRDRLAGIEYARTPLRYEVAKRMSQHFDLNQGWLAFGRGNPIGRIDISEELEMAVPVNVLFAEGFQKHIWPKLSIGQRRLIEQGGIPGLKVQFSPAGLPPERHGEWALFQELRSAIKAVPIQDRNSFARAMVEAIGDFFKDRGLKFRSFGFFSSLRPPESKLIVDTEAAETIVRNVSSAAEIPTWKEIVRELKRLTDSPGAKAQLAGDLKTTRQNVNKWLSGHGAPSAELTLAVLRWVINTGRKKQKNSGDASGTTGAETRKRKSSNEKPKSSQSQK